jgi:integrase
VKRRKAGLTFQECAEQYIAAHKAGWKNSKHSAQWASTLSTYAYPKIGLEPVNEIDTAAVMRCLQPIWADKNETAARLRGRIEAILDWARVSEYRSGENPARWRGHLQKLLAKRAAVSKVRHHPAMPYSEVPEFFRRLAMQNGIAARSLSFLILTATRTSEVTGARWREIDLKERLWIIPAERMKMGKEHRVPLSASCAAVLDAMKQLGEESDGLIFPGAKPGIPQSENTMLALLRRMDCAHVTVHGFRSSFRDWAAETTPYANEVLEKALAHGIKDKAEAAYRRGHLFDKRVSLMKDWADFCEGRTLAK